MRELKFRVWCPTSKHFSTQPWLSCDGLMMKWDHTSNKSTLTDIRFDEYIIQQYTGLKDKNGKEIYEGDIVKAKTWYPEEDGLVHPTSIFDYMGVVKFGYGGFYICEEQTHESLCFYYESDEFQVFPNSEIELIGNIMENPELLK
jgi:uncharacterized phage protein (TIGR01671 family)